MKKSLSTIKSKIVSRYIHENESSQDSKSTNINILLNRVKLVRKEEGRKKLLFTAVTSLSLVLFGVLIF